jgi:group II intron reverse transcriptase/maturase
MPKENIQQTLKELYARAKCHEIFTDLMPIILNRENILLAYRNIKSNSGSNTPGTDGLTIKDIERFTSEEVIAKVRLEVSGRNEGYQPQPVRRKDIAKPNGNTRPLGIPCIWDRLIQQCFKQVLEPICEAHFSKHSYGFRPNRSVEHAIAAVSKYLQLSHLHYVIEFDIKGFFDNVNHSKLIRQM